METLSFDPFSHPDRDATARRQLLERLLARDAQARTTRFLRRAAAQLDEASGGLSATLSQWTEAPATLTQVFGYPLALAPFRQLDVDPIWSAAMAALHLHAAGVDGEWRATFARPSALRWGDLMTRPVQRIAVSAQAGEAHLRLVAANGSIVTVRMAISGADPTPADAVPGGWRAIRSADLRARRLTLVDHESAAVIPIADAFNDGAPPPNTEIVKTLERAGELLRQYAPGFLAWVTDADWAVVPIGQPGKNQCTSYSSRGMPGVSFLSFPIEPLLAAELLVHETSHNYFHCAQLDGELCNGNDAALYHSPFVRQDRPIDRILIAFHAFANIVLLYRTMLAAGLDERRDLAEGAIAHNLPILAEFSAILTRSAGLTEAGRALFEPLRDCLFAGGGPRRGFLA